MMREGDNLYAMTVDQTEEWLAQYYLDLLERIRDKIEAYYARI